MQGEFDFNKYPYKAGHRKVRTSVIAADDINKQLSRLQKMVLLELEKVLPLGLTTSELANRCNKNLLTIRPRTTELKLQNLIIDTEKTRKNEGGKPEIIYKLRALDVIDIYGLLQSDSIPYPSSNCKYCKNISTVNRVS